MSGRGSSPTCFSVRPSWYRDQGDKQKFYAGEIPPEFVLESGDMLVTMTEQAVGLLGSTLIVPEDDRNRLRVLLTHLLKWQFQYIQLGDRGYDSESGAGSQSSSAKPLTRRNSRRLFVTSTAFSDNA